MSGETFEPGTWYVVKGWSSKTIRRVEVERVTESSVWINGRRHARRSESDAYFPEFVQAKVHWRVSVERRLQAARKEVAWWEADLAEVMAFEESDIT